MLSYAIIIKSSIQLFPNIRLIYTIFRKLLDILSLLIFYHYFLENLLFLFIKNILSNLYSKILDKK